MKEKNKKKNGPLVLLMLDGLGIAPDSEGNAISQAKLPFFKELVAKYPSTVLSVPAEHGQKIANPALCYSVLGSGSFPLKKKISSFLGSLTLNNKKWKVLAETERIPLVGFFLNGRKKISADHCLWIKEDGFSESSRETIKQLKAGKIDFLGIFSAQLENASRSGDLSSAIAKAEDIDPWLAKITKIILEKDGTMLLSAAFGKAESTIDVKTDKADKSNTLNPVPFIVIGKEFEGKTFGFPEAPGNDLSTISPVGTLADIAPTILSILNITPLEEFSGKKLI